MWKLPKFPTETRGVYVYVEYVPICEARCWRSHGVTGRLACGTNARVHEITGLPLRSLDDFFFLGKNRKKSAKFS